MSVYEVDIDPDELDPMSDMGKRYISTWRGVKNKSLRGRHITDGTLLVDKKHVTGEDLFEKLKNRKSDQDVENERIKNLVNRLKDEEQWVGKVRGQMTRGKSRGMGSVGSKWIAVVGYRNYKKHAVADAQAVQMARKLVGESADMKVGKSEILTWHKYGVPVAAVATWSFYKPNIK